MGKFEDHYDNKQAISKADQDKSLLIEYNNDVDFVQKIAGRLMARFVANPPDDNMWVNVRGVRFAAWRIADLGMNSGYVVLLSDGRLVKCEYNRGEVFIPRHINNVSELSTSNDRKIISAIKNDICSGSKLDNLGIKGHECQHKLLYGRTAEHTGGRKKGFKDILKEIFS